MTRVLVLGASGMLGYATTEFYRSAGASVIPLSRREFDVASDDIESLEPYMADIDDVINCAGVIKPMIAHTTIENVLRVNAVFPRNLARLCKSRGIRCFHVTTDCVYSGRRGRYTEADYFDAEDVYGMSKNAGDINDCMTLRTSIIGEENGQSRSLLSWARSQAGKEVNGFTNHRWNGVTTVQLAEIIQTIIDRKLYQPGIFHIHSPDTVTKSELLTILSEVYGLGLIVNPTEADTACDRSLSSAFGLNSAVSRIPIREQVLRMRDFFRKLSPC